MQILVDKTLLPRKSEQNEFARQNGETKTRNHKQTTDNPKKTEITDIDLL